MSALSQCINSGIVMHAHWWAVVTSHASQGKTVDRVIVSQSSQSFPASSQSQFYVSASRGREQVLVFTDDKFALMEAVEQTNERLSGTELVNGVPPSPRRDRHPDLSPAINIPQMNRDSEQEITRG